MRASIVPVLLGCFGLVCTVAQAGVYLGTDYNAPSSEPNPVPVAVLKPAATLQPALGHYRPPQTTKETFASAVEPKPITTPIQVASAQTSLVLPPPLTAPMPHKVEVTTTVVGEEKLAAVTPTTTIVATAPVALNPTTIVAAAPVVALVPTTEVVAVTPVAVTPATTVVAVTPVVAVSPRVCGKAPCEPVLPIASYPIYDGLIVRLHTGSLRDNVMHIVEKSHWGHVVWTLPFDYKWIGDITVQGPNAQSVLSQLLKPYPVQAVFYNKNKVVAIVSRRPL